MTRSERQAMIEVLLKNLMSFKEKYHYLSDIPMGKLARSHRSVLITLSRFDALNMTQLAHEVNVSVQQITKTVNSLEDSGYVTRFTDRSNRRQVWVRLTDDGRQFLEERQSELNEDLYSCFRNITDSELKMLLENSSKLADTLRRLVIS